MKKKLLPWMLGLMVLPLLWKGCASQGAATPPNVILIMADDMGFECLGTY